MKSMNRRKQPWLSHGCFSLDRLVNDVAMGSSLLNWDKNFAFMTYTEHEKRNGMRKIGICLCLCFCFLCDVKAEGYCVMNGNDGTVVEDGNMHETQSVASISKVMSAIVAIEHGDLKDSWAVSDAILQADGSSIYLEVGETVTLEELLYGLMLRSGNDAAVEIAVHVGGDEAHFVEMMNEKAKELGMKDTLFRNPSGLDEADGGNISSAYDMALLMRYAMQNETFAKITSSKYYDRGSERWQNKNKLLFSYDKTTGGKTGYTKHAGRTLITTASDDDLDSIVVTLGFGDDFNFHQAKHEAQFRNYHIYTLLKQGSYHIQGYTFAVPETIRIALSNDEEHEISVHTRISGNQLLITVEKDGQTLTYEYLGVKDRAEKKGWFS